MRFIFKIKRRFGKFVTKSFFNILLAIFLLTSPLIFPLPKEISELVEKKQKVEAHSTYSATGADLVVGTTDAVSTSNTGGIGATFGNDNIQWQMTRIAAATSLDVQYKFDGVELMGSNKMTIFIEDGNAGSAVNYNHQICDWTSSTGVDDAADGVYCTGGGWRNLHPQDWDYSNITGNNFGYDIYDGYFWDTDNAVIYSTPLTNFIRSGDKQVRFRAISRVNSTVGYDVDYIYLEMGIDPVYEVSDLTVTSGTTTGSPSAMVGAVYTNLTASDGIKFQVAMPANSVAADFYFTLKNVKLFTGANTILVMPEACVSNTAMTFGVYLYNFDTTSYTQLGTDITGSACGTDTDYAMAFNSTSIGSFDINDYVDGSGNVRVRFLTNAPATARNIQFDRMYVMIGAVNSDSAKCEISWGTGTATNCTNTRSIVNQAKTATPAGSTWQATAALEYPTTYYALDNDDDATNAEYATSQNLSFPVTLDSDMSVTSIHYALKFRSNSTAQTASPQIRDYSGVGTATSSGWIDTPGTDNNNATTYSWFDTWGLSEFYNTPQYSVDTVNNLMNIRLRTSAGTTTNPGTRDWAFAFMSIRWVEESARNTVTSKFTPTGSSLITGSEVATSNTNTGDWKATLGDDATGNGSANYWTTSRHATNGLNKQLQVDGVQLYAANKIIIRVEDTNITTGNAYLHQICDWSDTTGVDNAADSECTGGGWRTLNSRKEDYTNTSDTTRYHEIYDGYFIDTTGSPGTTYSTPLSNFINTSSNNRLLFRVYSTVGSTVQHRLDFLLVETAIDPVYEPTALTKINSFAGATTNSLANIRGTSASDNTRFTIANTAGTPMDFYLSFNNVKTYTGANTLVFKPEFCVSNTALTFDFYVYNFTTPGWEKLNTVTSPTSGSACTTDTAYAYAKNNVTLTNYISAGEVRFRVATTTSNTHTFQFDRLYMMLGSTNTSTSLCEISWGTGTATDCSNTRDVQDTETTTTANTSTWALTTTLEYTDSNFYVGDNDNDGTGGEAAVAANLSLPITITSGMSITGIHYAARLRSNITTVNVSVGIRDYGGRVSNGWGAMGNGNASTSYSWTDSWQSTEQLIAPDYYVDTVNNLMSLRLRTNTSTDTTGGTVTGWDFAMMSIRWIEPQSGTLSVDIVDSGGVTVGTPSVAFGNITTNFTCQTSNGTFGTSSQKIRVTNDSANPQWSLTIAASDGITGNWSTGGSEQYDFNDSGGSPSGCADGGDADSIAGMLSFDFSGATITPEGGCSNTGITLGSNANFVQGTTDSITIATASGSAQTGCYWDITDIYVTQKIPSDQFSGNYSIDMGLTVTAN